MLRFNCYLPKIYLKATKVKYGKNLKLIGWPVVVCFPDASLSIGDDVTINSNVFSNLLGLYQRTIIVAKNKGQISIGDRVGISGATIYSWESIHIGDDTLIGANTKIVDNDFHPIDAQERIMGNNDKVKSSPVLIGNNCFIGMNSIILKGTTLGNNCVVGAGSVVRGIFEDNSIIAGNPARLIRKL